MPHYQKVPHLKKKATENKKFQDFSKFCDRPQQGGHFGLLIKDNESKEKYPIGNYTVAF